MKAAPFVYLVQITMQRVAPLDLRNLEGDKHH